MTTLQANRVPLASLTSYTRAKPPYATDDNENSIQHNFETLTSPRKPTLLNWCLPCLSVIILGGDGGVVLLFCLDKGGEEGTLGSGFGCDCGWWLT